IGHALWRTAERIRSWLMKGGSNPPNVEGKLSLVLIPFNILFAFWMLAFGAAIAFSMVYWLANFIVYIFDKLGFISGKPDFIVDAALAFATLAWILLSLGPIAFRRRRTITIEPGKRVVVEEEKPERIIELPFLSFGVGILFGLLHFLSFYALVTGVSDFGRLTMEFLIYASAAFGTVWGAMFYVQFSAPSFISRSRRTRQLAWVELCTYGLVAYLVIVTLYASSWYARLPHYLGGDRPAPVSIWVEDTGGALDLSAQLPNAGCLNKGPAWKCERACLVDVSGDQFILSDSDGLYATALAIQK